MAVTYTIDNVQTLSDTQSIFTVTYTDGTNTKTVQTKKYTKNYTDEMLQLYFEHVANLLETEMWSN